MNTISADTKALNAEVRAQIYKILAKSFLYPTKDFFDSFGTQEYTQALLRYCSLNAPSSELQATIQGVCEMLKSGEQGPTPGTLEYEYNRLFAHLGSAKCPPYETEYGYDNVFQKTQTMADIAGFYKAYGLEVSDTNAERVDFLSTELEFMAFLSLQEAYAREHGECEHIEVCVDTQRKFMKDHLGRWTGIFTKILSRTTQEKFYENAGKQLEEFVGGELGRLNVFPEEVTAPSKEPPASQEPFGCEGCVSPTSAGSTEKT